MARLNLTIPDPLYDRLERWRERVNISRVCANALEQELAMLEGNIAAASGDPRVERLLQRLQSGQERKDRWYQRGYQDGEKWAIETASPDEIRKLGEEWEIDDYSEAIEDIDEDDFPSLHPSDQVNEWIRADLAEAGEDSGRDSFRRAQQQVERGAYFRGWHQAVRSLWQTAGPALRRFVSE